MVSQDINLENKGIEFHVKHNLPLVVILFLFGIKPDIIYEFLEHFSGNY